VTWDAPSRRWGGIEKHRQLKVFASSFPNTVSVEETVVKVSPLTSEVSGIHSLKGE